MVSGYNSILQNGEKFTPSRNSLDKLLTESWSQGQVKAGVSHPVGGWDLNSGPLLEYNVFLTLSYFSIPQEWIF